MLMLVVQTSVLAVLYTTVKSAPLTRSEYRPREAVRDALCDVNIKEVEV